MATVSFYEKVVVTNPEMVAKMRKDLDDPSPVELRNQHRYTHEKGQENAKKWLLVHGVKTNNFKDG